MEELFVDITHGVTRKSKKISISPEIIRKLGDATQDYAHGRYEEAIPLLKKIIRISPSLVEPYHTLGLIHNVMGDKKRALAFYMLAAHLTPKDVSLWKLLVTFALEQGNCGHARYCLERAIQANPEDMGLQCQWVSLFPELGEH
ncbi:uncharacterized protein LOC143537738 [Bidens hawaiensis]|uniref:uncharacterized protein LOC143537738 n=1 Tax=Bidens hawaiensis TaxID=980011 RepID=UPI0040497012